ncbi:peptidase M1 [Modestobacter sp. NPDC049651]|uniref:peptidase M1 n=1 Tax=unclassified Modestobacter TaxID=2643866 RepID=UPI0033DF9258
MAGRRVRALAALPLATALALTGCGGDPERRADPAPPTADAGGCPSERAAPDPHRPRVDLRFSLADDRRTVTGRETVEFTPDLPTAELVFRLLPNAPDAAAEGNALTVDAVTGPDVAGSGYEPAGGAGPGGLHVVRLGRTLAPGETTRVRLDFTTRLGSGGFDRLGVADAVSWWGSGAPLLAWEPGTGWARDPYVPLVGETAVSPAADTTVSVTAPADLTVLMTGDQEDPVPAGTGRRTWRAHEPAARDVSVAAGEFTTATEQAGDVRVTSGVLADQDEDGDPDGDPDGRARELAAATADAVRALSERFGPFPYRTLTVPQLPPYGGGIEYPSSVQLAVPTGARRVLVHEVGHMWFYGMVGNSQFRDPWLDESFAGYTETVTDPLPPDEVADALRLPGGVGGAMSDFPDDDRYVATVYEKGAAALVAAREAAGAAAFDAAVRCYVDARAWAVATPADVGTALAGLPAALEVLRDVGALDADDLPD